MVQCRCSSAGIFCSFVRYSQPCLGIFQVRVPQLIIQVLIFFSRQDALGEVESKSGTQPDFTKDCGDQLILQSELTAAIRLSGYQAIRRIQLKWRSPFPGPRVSPSGLSIAISGSEL